MRELENEESEEIELGLSRLIAEQGVTPITIRINVLSCGRPMKIQML